MFATASKPTRLGEIIGAGTLIGCGTVWEEAEPSSSSRRLRGGGRTSGALYALPKVQVRPSLEQVLQGCSPLHLGIMLA